MKQTDKVNQLLGILEEQYNKYIAYKKECDNMYKEGYEETAYYYDMKRSITLDNIIEIKNTILAIVEELENK